QDAREFEVTGQDVAQTVPIGELRKLVDCGINDTAQVRLKAQRGIEICGSRGDGDFMLDGLALFARLDRYDCRQLDKGRDVIVLRDTVEMELTADLEGQFV